MQLVTINGVRYIPAPPLAEKPELLDFEYDFMDVGVVRVRDYLRILLTKLWVDGEDFKGKYPFGNSGWQYELWYAMVKAGAVEGKIDEEGDVYHIENKQKADELIVQLIGSMCRNPNDQE